MRLKTFTFGVFLLASVSTLAVVAQQDNTPPASPIKRSVAHKQTGQPPTEGERVFKQNCSRCHTAPEGFSPSIAGTIVRHMRVRASLSQHEEEQLLQFLNPK
jgi:mono/diheme cytochrome c family protein